MYDESVNGWQHDDRCQPFFLDSRPQAPIQGFRSGRGAEEALTAFAPPEPLAFLMPSETEKSWEKPACAPVVASRR
jgi:hypothetical protein